MSPDRLLYAEDLDEQLAASRLERAVFCTPLGATAWLVAPCHPAATLLVGYASQAQTVLLACAHCQREVARIAVQPRLHG